MIVPIDVSQLDFEVEVFVPIDLKTAALMCGFRTVEEFLDWAEPHIVRGEN